MGMVVMRVVSANYQVVEWPIVSHGSDHGDVTGRR